MSDVPVADLVLRNAKVVTFTASQPRAESIAVKDGRVLAVGSDDELAPLTAAARHTADLDGRVVLPGLNDSHIHAMRAGLDWARTLHWEDVRSLAETLGRVREAAAWRQAGEWIRVVGGWHSRQLRENRLPTRAELDAAAPDHPVYIQELYSRAVLNSAALARCGWDSTSADPPGGRLLRDASGSLTGEVTGLGAFAAASAPAGTADLEEEIRGTAAMMAAFAGHGLTGVVDGGGMATAPRDYDALYELWRREGLTVRTRLFMCTWTPGREVGDYEQLTTVGQPDFGDAMLKVSGAGEMPHSGCHDFGGLDAEFSISDDSYDELLQITRLCARHGWRISVHAVLDSSLSRVLDAWEQVERETGRISQLRCSIVHADGASEASIRRLATLRAGVLVQNRLLLEGADYVRAWGQEAADVAPRIGVMRQLGIPVGGGSDGTRANRYSPWASIGWLVTGRSIDGATRRHGRDRLSRHDAIASYTRDAAWFTGEDGWRGRLSPGYDADLCVPTADPFECAEDVLYDLRSDLTLVSGRVIHTCGDFEGLRTADTRHHALATTARFVGGGLPTATGEDTACCYAVQDMVWVTGPGDEPWEVYLVKDDARHPRQGDRLRLVRPGRQHNRCSVTSRFGRRLTLAESQPPHPRAVRALRSPGTEIPGQQPFRIWSPLKLNPQYRCRSGGPACCYWR